ncbi:hypothetical protein IAU59_006995 [Kwoniella sp. CBS 9459]
MSSSVQEADPVPGAAAVQAAERPSPVYVGQNAWLKAVFEWRCRDHPEKMPIRSVDSGLAEPFTYDPSSTMGDLSIEDWAKVVLEKESRASKNTSKAELRPENGRLLCLRRVYDLPCREDPELLHYLLLVPRELWRSLPFCGAEVVAFWFAVCDRYLVLLRERFPDHVGLKSREAKAKQEKAKKAKAEKAKAEREKARKEKAKKRAKGKGKRRSSGSTPLSSPNATAGSSGTSGSGMNFFNGSAPPHLAFGGPTPSSALAAPPSHLAAFDAQPHASSSRLGPAYTDHLMLAPAPMPCPDLMAGFMPDPALMPSFPLMPSPDLTPGFMPAPVPAPLPDSGLDFGFDLSLGPQGSMMPPAAEASTASTQYTMDAAPPFNTNFGQPLLAPVPAPAPFSSPALMPCFMPGLMPAPVPASLPNLGFDSGIGFGINAQMLMPPTVEASSSTQHTWYAAPQINTDSTDNLLPLPNVPPTTFDHSAVNEAFPGQGLTFQEHNEFLATISAMRDHNLGQQVLSAPSSEASFGLAR